MGILMPVFTRDPRGHVVQKLVDSEQIPDGWVDSPDKVPGNGPAIEPAAPRTGREPDPAPVFGEPVAKRGPGRPRKRY